MGAALDDICFATVPEVAGHLRAGAVTALALTQRMLERIEKLQGVLKAFVTVTPEAALEQAHTADAELQAGRDRGPLHGVPVAVKDLFDTRGIRTTAGSKHFENRVPERDARAVMLLREAGAVILGKTGLHELAWGTTSINPHFGAVANPWNPAHHPGGSSGGSAAAVAAGLAYVALGTDTGASVRQPAHCCGIVGHKPTFGLVSKAGVVPLAWSLDHVGPLTRAVRDAALALNALAGPDADDPYAVDRPSEDFTRLLGAAVRGSVIGVPRPYFFEGGDSEVVAIVETALETFDGLGARRADLAVPEVEEALVAARTVFVEAFAAHGEIVRAHPADFSEHIRSNMESMAGRSATEYAEALRFRLAFRKRLLAAMEGCSVLAVPTSTVAAERIDAQPADRTRERWKNTGIFNLTGFPAVSVPCGFTRAGLPVGLMIVGRPFEDAEVLRHAEAFERATPWHTRHPPLDA